MSLFQFWFERRECPCASAETSSSVRRERPVNEEEEKEEGSKEDGYKAPAAETWKVPKSQ